MEASTKKILSTLAVAAAVGGGFYLFKKGKKLLAGAKMNFALLGFRIHKMNLQEVQFVVKLRCYNPTSASITLAIPQVVANYKGSKVAYSTPDITGLTIEAGKQQESEIVFDVPYLNLLGKGLTLSVLSNTTQLKADLTFTLTITVNNETLTTTQSLADDSQTSGFGSLHSLENNINTKQHMNGLTLGELGIVSGPRVTQDGKKYNHLIKRADGKEVFIKKGNVIITVENCIDIIASHHREVEDLAQRLQGDSLKATCRNIFNFSYTYLQYHKDEDGIEQLRTPARSWLDGQIKYKQEGKKSSGIDCDDYSIFVGSILRCLGIPFKLRITKYDGRKNFQHIYVFVPDNDDSENEIIIDPVLSKFDYQKPYSFEKSDFNMSPLDMIAGIHGIDGLSGEMSLGLPIYALSGLDLAGGRMVQDEYTDLMAIVSGVDFEPALNGLGDADDATYNYLVRTRDFLLKNKDNKDKMAHIQNPDQFISMLDQAIKFWNTPKRDSVLDKLADIEEKLAENGLIKYDSEAIQGIAELNELDEMDGLGRRKRKKGRFFKALKSVGGKVKKGVKKVGKAAKKVAKKAVKAVVKFNPLTIAIRGGLLAALRLNMFGISKKLQYAYLPDSLSSKYNLDTTQLAKLKKTHLKVKKLFKGLQGKEENLRKAILKGAKQSSSDFSLKGLKALESIGELAELGNLGVVATAASVSAASGVLAKIGSWLKPIKNIFSKIKSKKNKTTSSTTATTQLPSTMAETYASSANNAITQTTSYTPQTATLTTTSTQAATTKKKLGKGAKIGIGIGVAALLGTGAYFLFNKTSNKKPNKSKAKKPTKKTLGSIKLQ